MWSHTEWVIAAWTSVVSVLVLFALLALYIASKTQLDEPESTESFLTARHSVKGWRIAWSFFAGALGSWAIGAPANYAVSSGLLGLVMYSIASGFPVLLIAAFGGRILDQMPHVTSAPEFVGWRFGALGQLYVMGLVLFNMSIAMLAEYCTMASLFKDFVRTVSSPIIIAMSVLTLVYTTVGGLLVSIVTDQFQGMTALALVIVIAVYIGKEFRSPALSQPFPTALKGFNKWGYSSILTMPVSLASSTLFSEAMWQRAWASKSRGALWFGAIVGSLGITSVVFFFGFCGSLAAWAGFITADTNPNLYVFQLFKKPGAGANSQLNNWVELVILICAAVMSEGAVDSLQTGIMSTLSSYFLKTQPLFITRFVLVIVNIPLIVVALKVEATSILSLFLIANMVTTTAVIPTMLGLAKSLRNVYGGDQMFLSCVTSMLATGGYGCYRYYHNFFKLNKVYPKVNGRLIYKGFQLSYYSNGYSWEYFAAALIFSVVSVVVFIALGAMLSCCGCRVPSASKKVGEFEQYVYACWSAPYARAGIKGDRMDEPPKTAKVDAGAV